MLERPVLEYTNHELNRMCTSHWNDKNEWVNTESMMVLNCLSIRNLIYLDASYLYIDNCIAHTYIDKCDEDRAIDEKKIHSTKNNIYVLEVLSTQVFCCCNWPWPVDLYGRNISRNRTCMSHLLFLSQMSDIFFQYPKKTH